MKRKYNPESQLRKAQRNADNRAKKGKEPYVPPWKRRKEEEQRQRAERGASAASSSAQDAANEPPRDDRRVLPTGPRRDGPGKGKVKES